MSELDAAWCIDAGSIKHAMKRQDDDSEEQKTHRNIDLRSTILDKIDPMFDS